MNNFVNGLFLICVLTTTTNPSFSEEDVRSLHIPNYGIKTGVEALNQDSFENTQAEGRSKMDTIDDDTAPSKPLRSIFMGIYKNYKSTYLGNKTLTEYKQTLRETLKNKQQQNNEDNETLQNETDEDENTVHDGVVNEYLQDEEENFDTTTTVAPEIEEAPNKNSQNAKRKNKEKNSKPPIMHDQYNVGPALNLSLDMDNSIVKVNMDGESLKELISGRWLNDNSEEGRGKKYEMVTKILPLFILPFLIQSAIVPFLVTKLKLLLIKSMLIGKLAIFLLIISAFKNGNKMMQTYEVAPSYWAGEPSRRSELATAASNMAYNGYRVEGKPAAWIN